MKNAWRVLIAIGASLAYVGFTMDTTVSGVYNIGLLQRQQMLVMLGGVAIVGGIVLYAVRKLRQTREEEAAEDLRVKEAVASGAAELQHAWSNAGGRFSGVLRKFGPSVDGWIPRLLVALIVGFLWRYLLVPVGADVKDQDVLEKVAGVIALLLAFWPTAASTALRRLLLTNAALMFLSAGVVLQANVGEGDFDRVLYLSTIGAIVVASLIPYGWLRYRQQAGEVQGGHIPIERAHVLLGATALVVASFLVPPHELAVFDGGGVKSITTQYAYFGQSTAPIRKGVLLLQLILIFAVAAAAYIHAGGHHLKKERPT